MKISFVTAAIITLISFVGVSNAQHVQVFDGFSGGVFVGLAPVTATSGSVSRPNIAALAGQTIRIRFAAADASTASIEPAYVLIGTPPAGSVCTEQSPFSRPISGTNNRGRLIVGVDSVELAVPTDRAWKGTCRILSVKLRDGSEHIGRIFFK